MAFTTASFNNMLKDYMPYELLMEEVMKRDYFLNKVNKKMNWKGGEMQVPFMGGAASSISYGGLTDINEITEDRHVRGTVAGYKEIWGAMIFNDQDLAQHGTEQSFIKILPSKLEMFIDSMKQAVSINLLNGSHAGSVVFGAAGENLGAGIVVVDRPARFCIGQYIEIGTLTIGTAKQKGYISAIDISTGALTLVIDKALAGAVLVLTDTAVQFGTQLPVLAGDKFYVRGAMEKASGVEKYFTSLREQLLPASVPGGSTNLFGVNKLAYPHLQAPSFDGSGWAAGTLLENLFDSYNDTRTLGKGAPTDVVMSFKRLAACMKELELGATSFGGGTDNAFGRGFTVTDRKANVFGWTEITVSGVKGSLTLVGVQEMDDDVMFIVDWRALDLHSNGFFERRVSPEGNHFFEVRNTTGYQYVVDTRFFGELVCYKPSHCGIIYGLV